MQRTILFPSATNNFIAYNYYTDSDPGDSLSVYIDGVLMQQVSGLNRGGTNRIALAMGGPHIVRFEYAKNSSTDAGLDTARLDNVVCFSGTSVFEVHDFTGQTPGATPIGWNTGGTGTGWMPVGFRVTESTPHVTIVDKSTPTTEPSIDGVIRDKEYFRNGMRATRILLPDYANASGDHAVLYLGASTVTNALVIGLNARSATPLALGDEKSTVVLYFDANRAGSLDALGCPGNPTLPGPEDRQIVINLQAAAGVGTQVSSITQSKGACATGSFAWAAASAAEDWPATVTATETWGASKKDRGAVHTEIRIVLPTAVLNEGKLGFGLTHANTQGSLSFERFPYHDVEGAGPIEDNVYSWETLILGYTPGYVEQSENTFDHCCWPFGTSPGK